MRLVKRLAAFGIAAGLTVLSGMTAFAEEYSIVFSGVFTPAAEETGSTMSVSYYGIDFEGRLIRSSIRNNWQRTKQTVPLIPKHM